MGCSASKGVKIDPGSVMTPPFCLGVDEDGHSHAWALLLQPNGRVGLLSSWYNKKGLVNEKLYYISAIEKEGDRAIYLVGPKNTGYQFPFRKTESGRIIDFKFATEDALFTFQKTGNKLFDDIIWFLKNK